MGILMLIQASECEGATNVVALPSAAMATTDQAERNRERLRAFMKARGLTMNAWAGMANVSSGTLRNFLSGRSETLTIKTVQALADAANVAINDLIVDENIPRGVTTSLLPTPPQVLSSERSIPVYASAQGGPEGAVILSSDPIEWTKDYAPLLDTGGAFAIYVVGDSMEPAYSQGDLVFVHPIRPANRGADVVLLTQPDNEEDGERMALVKRLISWNKTHWTVAEFCPEYREFQLDRTLWRTAMRIEGKKNGN